MPIFHVHITLLFLLEKRSTNFDSCLSSKKLKIVRLLPFIYPHTEQKNSLANIKRLNPIYKPISFLQMTSVLPLTIFIILS